METINVVNPKWTLPCQTCGKERIFKRESSYKQALKLNNSNCYRCALPQRRLSKNTTLHVWERSCPACKQTISYRGRTHLERAVQDNSVCRSCYIQNVKKHENPQAQRKHWYETHREQVSETNRKNKQKILEKRKNGDIQTVMTLRLSKLKSRARIKNISMTLNVQDLIECYQNQNGKCYYSGIPLVMTLTGKGDITDNPYQITVDRIDTSKGYEKNNIVLCCITANSAKSVLGIDEFFRFVEKMYFTMKERLNPQGVS